MNNKNAALVYIYLYQNKSKAMRFLLVNCLLFSTLLTTAASTSTNQYQPTSHPQIPSLQNATKSDYPPFVSLCLFDKKSHSYKSFCGGTILHQNWVLTTAHCLDGKIDNIGTISVLAGFTSLSLNKSHESTESIFQVQQIIVHPQHREIFEFSNDLALVKIKGDFPGSDFAILQTSNQDLKGKATTLGWGKTSPDLKLLTEQFCQDDWTHDELMTRLETEDKKFVRERLVCLSMETRTCLRYPGGPLISGPKKALIGVASFSDIPDCHASFFMRVSYFVPWIKKTIGTNKITKPSASEPPNYSKEPDFRIIGGVRATKEDFPSIVSLSYPATQDQLNKTGIKNPPAEGGYVSFCGGTIIHPNWVLTAAHCLQDRGTRKITKPEEFRVLVGFTNLTPGKPLEPGEQIFQVAEVRVHKKYNRRFINAEDVALVRIQNGTFARERVAKIQKSGPYPEGVATAFGWGMKRDRDYDSFSLHLMKVDDDLCTDDQWIDDEGVGNSLQEFEFDIIKPVVICFGWRSDRGTCTGDSGGPLVYGPDKVLIGVASFVFRPCEKAGFFMRVKYYVQWIQEETGVQLDLRTIGAASALGPNAFSLAILLAVYTCFSWV